MPEEPKRASCADVIGVGMQKGGVAKTTNALHIAAALAERGKRVLLWDVDENYGATKVFGVAGSKLLTTMDVVTGACSVTEAILQQRSEGGTAVLPSRVDFIPSSRALQGLERRHAGDRQDLDLRNCLKVHVDKLKALDQYDCILIDSGPHASACTRSAYLVSDYFILSVIPEKQAIASLPDAVRDVVNAQRPGRNPNLHLLGLVLANLDRRLVLARYYEEKLSTGFLDREGRPVVFEARISIAAAIDRAYKENQLLLQYAPRHRVSDQYRALASEIEGRIQRHKEGLQVASGVDRGAPSEAVAHG